MFFFMVIGLQLEEDWPPEVTLSRNNFSPVSLRPITHYVPEINNQGAELLQVRLLVLVYTLNNVFVGLILSCPQRLLLE